MDSRMQWAMLGAFSILAIPPFAVAWTLASGSLGASSSGAFLLGAVVLATLGISLVYRLQGRSGIEGVSYVFLLVTYANTHGPLILTAATTRTGNAQLRSIEVAIALLLFLGVSFVDRLVVRGRSAEPK